MTTNWHTHTYRCKHASGDVDEYCMAAREQGLKHLGFSDHAPLPDGRWDSVRMGMDELPDYLQQLVAADSKFPELQLYRALECEYVPEFADFYQDEFLGRLEMDYLVGGAHWYPWKGEWQALFGVEMSIPMLHAYTDYLIASIQSGLFAFIAHPDLFGNCYFTWDDEATACTRAIVAAAREQKIPLEINAYGLRKPPIETPSGVRPRYPWLPFWEVAGEIGVEIIVNSDAHRPQDIVAAMDTAGKIADDCGLPRVDSPLPSLKERSVVCTRESSGEDRRRAR